MIMIVHWIKQHNICHTYSFLPIRRKEREREGKKRRGRERKREREREREREDAAWLAYQQIINHSYIVH